MTVFPERAATPLLPWVRTDHSVTTSHTSISLSLRSSHERISTVSSVPVAVSCHAVGASLAGVRVIIINCAAEVKTPSVTL